MAKQNIKLIQIIHSGNYLYGLDAEGQVWINGYKGWKKISMEAE